MSRKSKFILSGIVILLFGVFYLLQRYFNFGFKTIFCFILGISLLLLYHDKKKVWALIPSIYLLYFAIANSIIVINKNLEFIFPAMFFISPGIIFLILFFKNKKPVYITPASLLIWSGISFILSGLINYSSFKLFLISIGLSFYTEYFMANGRFTQKRLVFGTIFILLGLAGILFKIIPFVLIVFGIIVIYKFMKKK